MCKIWCWYFNLFWSCILFYLDGKWSMFFWTYIYKNFFSFFLIFRNTFQSCHHTYWTPCTFRNNFLLDHNEYSRCFKIVQAVFWEMDDFVCSDRLPNVLIVCLLLLQEQITYHQVSSIRLPRGLYLGYLKMRSSVDLLQVLVPSKTPNVPPHCKIRDNPHVTA